MSKYAIVQLQQDEREAEAVLRALARTKRERLETTPSISSTSLVWDSEANERLETGALPTYRLPYGDYRINDAIVFSYMQNSEVMSVGTAVGCRELLEFRGPIDNIEAYIRSCLEVTSPQKRNHIPCFIIDANIWKFLSYLPHRQADSVFHPQKTELFADLERFRSSEKEYMAHGIPYKRNYLFTGPPGTGKTSMMCAMATQMEASLYIIQMTQHMTDGLFMRLVSRIPASADRRCLMVLEDVDCLFTERVENDTGTRGGVSFSSILNTLDGVAAKRGLVTVMTTNYKERLDAALLRPGRIDMAVTFPYATEAQIREAYRSYFSGADSERGVVKLLEACRGRQVSMAALQKHLFCYRDDLDACIGALVDLETLQEQYSSNWYA